MIGMAVVLSGLTVTTGTVLLVPFIFALPPDAGIAMLGGLYVCAMFLMRFQRCWHTPEPLLWPRLLTGTPWCRKDEGRKRLSVPVLALLLEPCLEQHATSFLPGP